MPLDQFSETVSNQWTRHFDSSAVPGTYQILVDTSAGNWRVDTLTIVNLDTIDHNVSFSWAGADNAMIVQAKVPAGAGTGGVAPLDVFSLFPTSQQFLLGNVNNGGSLNMAIVEAVNAGKLVVVDALGGMF